MTFGTTLLYYKQFVIYTLHLILLKVTKLILPARWPDHKLFHRWITGKWKICVLWGWLVQLRPRWNTHSTIKVVKLFGQTSYNACKQSDAQYKNIPSSFHFNMKNRTCCVQYWIGLSWKLIPTQTGVLKWVLLGDKAANSLVTLYTKSCIIMGSITSRWKKFLSTPELLDQPPAYYMGVQG